MAVFPVCNIKRPAVFSGPFYWMLKLAGVLKYVARFTEMGF